MRRHSVILILAAALALLLGGCVQREQYRRCSGMVWNTVWNVTYRGPESLEDSIRKVFDRVGASLSAFDAKSLVSRLNDGDSVECDSMLRRVYATSVRVNRESGGSFDPTLGPLITAWGFGKGHTPTADTARIDEILRYVGIEKTRLAGNTIVKSDRRTTFNFSAIAKGYGCDAVGAMLRRNGVTDYLVEIGGEIAMSGESPSGKDWVIAIDKPTATADVGLDGSTREVESTLALTDCGVATSGNYRNYHENGGQRYGHTIDRRSGRPVQTDVVSATVVAPTCMEADAYATACMAMGSHRALAMADSLHLSVMLILADGTVQATGRLK